MKTAAGKKHKKRALTGENGTFDLPNGTGSIPEHSTPDFCSGVLPSHRSQSCPVGSASDKPRGTGATRVYGQLLHIENLDGRVTKVQAFRGTICSVEPEDYLIRKIRGDEQPDVKDALNKYEALKSSLEELMRGLWWSDFELLADLVFAQSGWQRVLILGKTEKDIDIAILSPVTGKRAFVQVKSRANLATLEQSITAFRQMPQYDEMYFVVHTADGAVAKYSEPGVAVIDISRLAELVMTAGLVDWLIKKRS